MEETQTTQPSETNNSEKRGEDNFIFTGGSQITSYNGDVLSSAPNDEIHQDFVDIDIKNARNKNLNDFNNYCYISGYFTIC